MSSRFRAPLKFFNFRSLDVTDFEPDMANYSSAELSSDQLEKQFRKDELAGLMRPTTEAAVEAEYGPGRLLVAAMGAVSMMERGLGQADPPSRSIMSGDWMQLLRLTFHSQTVRRCFRLCRVPDGGLGRLTLPHRLMHLS